MNRNIVVLSILALTVLVSGCTSLQGDEAPDTEETPSENDTDPEASDVDSGDDTREIVVKGGNYYFETNYITVEQGETVRFVFENDGGRHDMRIPDLSAGTSVIQTGESESFEVTFDETGTFKFLCSVSNHAELGMNGTITVK